MRNFLRTLCSWSFFFFLQFRRAKGIFFQRGDKKTHRAASARQEGGGHWTVREEGRYNTIRRPPSKAWDLLYCVRSSRSEGDDVFALFLSFVYTCVFVLPPYLMHNSMALLLVPPGEHGRLDHFGAYSLVVRTVRGGYSDGCYNKTFQSTKAKGFSMTARGAR